MERLETLKNIKLTRFETSDHGTFGVIYVDDEKFYSGEKPWRDNKNNISCIPEGIYPCIWTYSPKFKRYMYLLGEVDERNGIRIHPANLMGDKTLDFDSHLHGCIALGYRLGYIEDQKALLISRPAVKKFELLLNYEPFYLEVINDFSS